jgi:hypothetical protein
MGASSEQLEKLLNALLPKKFPDVKRVDVQEEELDKHTYYIHVWVVMKNDYMFVVPNDVDTTEFVKIQKEIRQLAKYAQLHINQITFGKDN